MCCEGKILGGICDATTFLGKMEILNDVDYTSNDLKKWAGMAYTGQNRYVIKQAVRDKNIITASATSAYNLLSCDFLYDDFHIYAVDTIGHPGKSAEVSLSPKNYEYGKWASEVISALGYEKMSCFAGSYGAVFWQN